VRFSIVAAPGDTRCNSNYRIRNRNNRRPDPGFWFHRRAKSHEDQTVRVCRIIPYIPDRLTLIFHEQDVTKGLGRITTERCKSVETRINHVDIVNRFRPAK